MRPCCEQEPRDAIEDLGLIPDDDDPGARTPMAGALRGVGRPQGVGCRPPRPYGRGETTNVHVTACTTESPNWKRRIL